MILRMICTGLLGLAIAMPGPTEAGQHTVNEPIKAKRVKPPPPGTKKRITVQIDPNEPVYRARPAPAKVEPEEVHGASASPGLYVRF